MSTTVDTEVQIATPARRARRAWIIAGALLAALAAIVWGWHWWQVGRFIETTDDAYVRADVVTVSPRVTGYVTKVLVGDNQRVRRGDLLATQDDRDFRARVQAAEAALEEAQAALQERSAAAQTLGAQLGQQASVIAQAQADVDAARAESARRDADASRYHALLADEAASGQRWESAHADALKARAALAHAVAAAQSQHEQSGVLRKRLAQNDAATAAAHARLAAAQAQLALARLDLEHTRIIATQDGMVGQRSVRAGQYVEAGTPLLALVPMQAVYVVANFKETQLAAMRAGEPVELDIDTFSGRVLRGRVSGIAPGSGAEFALLPPDNATGNFTKIVQRVPVKIALETVPRDVVLRPGMSVIAHVDTKGTTR
ncbi:HlyD family secretion protein [Paraburkholderia bannensis]|uniref:HlyD family secretion protein n=1 Tax=Paraburkholderia bannensis TaxID=765414 RepID=UPI002AC35D99|nr:HlyD family secretion protein [Paraburkholderia bannensis]